MSGDEKDEIAETKRLQFEDETSTAQRLISGETTAVKSLEQCDDLLDVTQTQRLKLGDDDDDQNDSQHLMPRPGRCDEELPVLGPDEHHAFLAHSSDDRLVAYDILAQMEAAGFKCLLADRDFLGGTTIFANLSNCIQRCRKTIFLISESFIQSVYFHLELSETLHYSSRKKQCTYIPLLYKIDPSKVPSLAKSITYIVHGDDGWFDRLKASLVRERPLIATIPAGNVAHGLAWSYYYSYLAIILPGLENRLRTQTTFATDKQIPILIKFICIMPLSCRCPATLHEVDANIRTVGKVAFKTNMAGVRERDYSTDVHLVTHPDTQQQYHFLGEFATPLRTLHAMEEGGLAGLSPAHRQHQTKLFEEKLREILQHPSLASTHNKYRLLTYHDVASRSVSSHQPPVRLSRLIADAVRHELDKCERVERELSETYLPPNHDESHVV